jgi:hypothetical protein
MNIIIKNDNFKIGQGQDEKDKTSFTIFFDSYNEALIKSIAKTKIILGATTTEKYKTLSFKASSVLTFTDFQRDLERENKTNKLTYNLFLKMTHNLVTQLNYLITHVSKTFLGFSLKNLVVVDKHKFIYVSDEFLLDIINEKDYSNDNKKDKLLITFPFTHEDFFLAPELLDVKELPSLVHYKVSYFSFGCLLLHALLGEYNLIDLNEESQLRQNNVKRLLNALFIKNTKVYWLLERCLVEEPKNRSILFV